MRHQVWKTYLSGYSWRNPHLLTRKGNVPKFCQSRCRDKESYGCKNRIPWAAYASFWVYCKNSLLWNLKVHHRRHKITPLDHILTQLNPAHNLHCQIHEHFLFPLSYHMSSLPPWFNIHSFHLSILLIPQSLKQNNGQNQRGLGATFNGAVFIKLNMKTRIHGAWIKNWRNPTLEESQWPVSRSAHFTHGERLPVSWLSGSQSWSRRESKQKHSFHLIVNSCILRFRCLTAARWYCRFWRRGCLLGFCAV